MSLTLCRVPMGLLLTCVACSATTRQEPIPEHSPVTQAPPLQLDLGDLSIDGDTGPFEATWAQSKPEPGLLIVRLELRAEQPSVPAPITLTWSVPSVDIDGHWTPNIGMDKSTYWANRVSSRATTNAPVIALISAAGRNRMTVALSDALNRIELSSYLREEDARFHVRVGLFTESMPETDFYALELRVDLRSVPYECALADVASWWAAQEGYAPAPVPTAARTPMYSTWYSFHQDLSVDAVLAELTVAKELGYDAVIVDDGWQTTDSQRGYAFTGDWQPERIGDMRGFVERAHALDMKFILWYSLPFMGDQAQRRAEFEGQFLSHSGSLQASTLDPRYPEVREFIIGTYEQALRDWDLDGFKLDFIDRFVPGPDTVLTAEDGRDHASVNAAVDRLMTDVMARLREINPDIMIEFRQSYIGPLMRKYGNMFRAVDCPNNAAVNRARVVDLRLLSGDTAVHSDMLMWHMDEPVEHAALQLLNVLFSVPQLSVRLLDLPPDHLEMVRFWTSYWKENSELLLSGSLTAPSPGASYPLLVGERSGRIIAAVFGDHVVDLTSPSATVIDVINAKHSASIVVRTARDLGVRRITTYDTTGRVQRTFEVELGPGLHELAVPPSGLIRMARP